MDDILFSSNTEIETEFEYNGEAITNKGNVQIVSKEFLDKLLLQN